MKNSACHKILYWRCVAIDAHIKIQHFWPKRDEKAELPLLSGIFLGDLQFDGFIGAAQAGKKRRSRFAYLEIDWTILDLNDDVLVEVAVQRVEVIVSGLRAIVFQVVPIQMVVVDEGAIKDDTPLRIVRK